MGDTMLLATVVSSKEAKEGIDFLPLTVDYREKFAAAGRFPGGFLKREGRPSDQEILGMRLVDRVLRPLFPKDYHCETQVMIQLMSHDPNVCPDSLLGLAASTALSLSDIPFSGPISEARVGRIDNQFVINPSKEDLLKSDIDLMIGASKESVVMVEGEMQEISESEMIEAIKFAHEAIKKQFQTQENLAKQIGKKETRDYGGKIEDAESIKSTKKSNSYSNLVNTNSNNSYSKENITKSNELTNENRFNFKPMKSNNS
jgi:polyribonucleotide nucleotidyltransferase